MTEIKPKFLDGEIDSRWYINLRTPKLKMTEQEHLECEIQKYEIELQQHEDAIDRLKVRIEKKKRELNKRQETEKPKKLLEIIETWIKNSDERSKWDNLVDVIQEQWIPKELKILKYDNYAHGWNDCLNRLKLTLK